MEIIRQNRKTISVALQSSGELIIKAPIKCSKSKIDNFLNEKTQWILRQRQKLEKINAFKESFDFKHNIYLLGEKWQPEIFELGMLLEKELKKERVEKIYIDYASAVLPEMIKEISQTLRLEYQSFKLTSSKRIWGSFDRGGNIKLNWKCIVLPRELISYVIIHELCHGLELNHSPKFWANVKNFCPKYKKYKKELQLYSFLLNQDII